MTLDLERSAIETYFIAAWNARTPLLMDGDAGDNAVGTCRLTITPGARLQGSVGRTLNRIDNVGIVTISIYTNAALGSVAWRSTAQAAIDTFHGVTIDQDGAVITATEDAFVRFSPVSARGSEQQHPYIAGTSKTTPIQTTNIIAPFVRYTYR